MGETENSLALTSVLSGHGKFIDSQCDTEMNEIMNGHVTIPGLRKHDDSPIKHFTVRVSPHVFSKT